MRLSTLHSKSRPVSEDSGSGSFACILVLLPSGGQKQCVCGWSCCLQFPSRRAAHILYAISLRDDDLYAATRYFHIAGYGGVPSPSLPTDPNSMSKLTTDQTKRLKKSRSHEFDVLIAVAGSLQANLHTPEPICGPIAVFKSTAGCLSWPSSSHHGWGLTSPQNHPRNSPHKHDLHHHHHHNRPFKLRYNSHSTRPKSNSAAR